MAGWGTDIEALRQMQIRCNFGASPLFDTLIYLASQFNSRQTSSTAIEAVTFPY